MSAIDDLATALSGPSVQADADANNPYLDLSKSFDTIPALVGTVAKNSPGTSISDVLLPTLLSSVAGGVLNGMGQDYSAELIKRSQAAAAATAAGQAPDPDSYVPPSMLTKAQNASTIFRMRSALENSQKDTDSNRALNSELALKSDPDLALIAAAQQGVASGSLTPQDGLGIITKAHANIVARSAALTAGAGGVPAAAAAPAADGSDAAVTDLSSLPSGYNAEQYASDSGVPYTPGMTKKDIDSIAKNIEHNSEPLPDADRKVYQSLEIAKKAAGDVLPILQRLEANLDPDQKNLSLAELAAQNLLPESDANVLKQQLPAVGNALANANPNGKVPKTEIDKYIAGFGSDAALASGFASQRLAANVDNATSSFLDTLKTAYSFPGSKYGKAADNYLASDIFNPIADMLPAQPPDPSDYSSAIAYKQAMTDYRAALQGVGQ